MQQMWYKDRVQSAQQYENTALQKTVTMETTSTVRKIVKHVGY
jgi:hypothetical protein